MKVGLIDVDGHHFPNLALMRIAAWHKARGDEVVWWWSDWEHYDVVYKSKVFSDAYSPDVPDPLNADKIIKGGTGYAIKLVVERESFDRAAHTTLPPEVEAMPPDYSIYPQYDFAVAMTTRGCPRGCGFCHVAAKEGRRSVKVADVSLFWAGQKEIKVLDANITACPEKRELFRQYRETGARIDFTQGLDIRLIDDDDISDINRMRLRQVHFAWDNPKEDLADAFSKWAREFRLARKGMVYMLVGFNSTLDEDLMRVYTLRDMGFDPYVMIYNKPNADPTLRRLQRWCNNKWIFNKVKDFGEYDKSKG